MKHHTRSALARHRRPGWYRRRNKFSGDVAGFCIFKRQRSSAEIAEIADVIKGRFGIDEAPVGIFIKGDVGTTPAAYYQVAPDAPQYKPRPSLYHVCFQPRRTT